MPRLYRKLGNKISKVKKKRQDESSIAPEIRTIPIAAKVTEVNIGTGFQSGSPQKAPKNIGQASSNPQQASDDSNQASNSSQTFIPPQQMSAPQQGIPVPMPNYPRYGAKAPAMKQQSILREKYEAISLW